MSWLGDRFSAMFDNITSIPGGIASAVSSAAGVASSGWDLGGQAASWVGRNVAAGATYVVNNPVETLTAVPRFLWWTNTHPTESIPLMFQGVVNAAGTTVGLAGDLIGNAGSLTVNTVSFLNNNINPLNAIPNLVGLNGMIETDYVGYQGFAATTYMTELPDLGIVDRIVERQGTPLNGYQRTMLFGSQAVAEIPAFIAVGAFTAGTGAVALGAARVGALGVRTAHMSRTGSMLARNIADDAFRQAAAIPARESFTNTAGAFARWADPRHGVFNRAAEGAAATLSMKMSWDEYSQGVSDRRNLLGDLLVGEADPAAAGDTPAPATTHISAAWSDVADAYYQRTVAIAHARSGSEITDTFGTTVRAAPGTIETAGLGETADPATGIRTEELTRG